MTKKVDEVTVVEEVKGTVDLLKISQETVSDLVQSGFIKEEMEKHMKKGLASVIDDVFGSYSTFSKAVKEELKNHLNVNLEELGLGAYNTLVMNMLKEKFDEVIKLNGIDKLKSSVEDMLSVEKKEWKLSEIINKMKEAYMKKVHDDDGESLDGMDCAFYYKKYSNLAFIDFDGNEDESNYACRYRLSVNKSGTINNLTIRGKEITNETIMAGLHGFDDFMLQLYISGATIILDPKEVDKYYDDCEEEY